MPAERATPVGSYLIRDILWSSIGWLALVTVVDVGVGVLVGSGMWWLGWTDTPIKDFFVTLAGLGGALLIAYSVTVTQVLPIFVRNAVRNNRVKVTAGRFGPGFGLALGVALAAVIGIGACLALVRDPSGRHWWLMALFGVGLFTLVVLAVAIGLGTMLYVFLFFED